MKLAKGMNLIAEGWIVKPKGFRVRFQQMTDGDLVTGYSPPMEDKHLDSDVTTWRYAWKLAMAAQPGENDIPEGSLVNVTVVDETDTPIVYYVTGKKEMFNPKP
ncbi:MAG: hypothetical protein MI892_01365 [Desulfobacterales bacterium]|nr:hypothetical protein [Desulfobacterales bacterium]